MQIPDTLSIEGDIKMEKILELLRVRRIVKAHFYRDSVEKFLPVWQNRTLLKGK